MKTMGNYTTPHAPAQKRLSSAKRADFFQLFNFFRASKSKGLRARLLSLLKEKGTEQSGTRAERPRQTLESVGKRRRTA